MDVRGETDGRVGQKKGLGQSLANGLVSSTHLVEGVQSDVLGHTKQRSNVHTHIYRGGSLPKFRCFSATHHAARFQEGLAPGDIASSLPAGGDNL